jgi:hypothetical protein
VNQCHLCGNSSRLVCVKQTGMWFCRDTVGCNYRSRLRLGIPKWQANQHRVAERAR